MFFIFAVSGLGAFVPVLSPTSQGLIFQHAPTSPTISAVSQIKRPKRDFSMYRTPSGKYYCSCCNLTLNSEVQFAQHMESKKHKSNQAAKRSTGAIIVTPSTETSTES